MITETEDEKNLKQNEKGNIAIFVKCGLAQLMDSV